MTQNVDGTELAARGLGLTQYEAVSNDLLSGPVEFRVLYDNNHDRDTNTDHANTKAIEGLEKQFTVSQLNADNHSEGNLPVINDSLANNAAPGLRFVYDDIYPTTTIKLVWEGNANVRQQCRADCLHPRRFH